MLAEVKMVSKPLALREFPMTRNNYGQIKNLVYEYTGIKLTDLKQEMIYGRLSRRVRSLKLKNFDQYCELICERANPEVSNFINAISTNLTAFFREPHHFDFLEHRVCKEILKSHQSNNSRIRIWSAGCSTGEEPYSIAMTLDRALRFEDLDIKILATDLDSSVLANATEGVYEAERFKDISNHTLRANFQHHKKEEGISRVKEKIRRYVHFKRLNLMEDWPMKGKFDVIFCRNVVIYFDAPTQRELFVRFANILKPSGYLFIGHSESLHGISDRFDSLGKTIYQLNDAKQ